MSRARFAATCLLAGLTFAVSPPHAGAQQPAAPAAPEEMQPAAGLRIWTDSSGKHKTEAEFLGLFDGKARLRKANGATIDVPLSALSAADRDFIQSMGAEQTPRAAEPTASPAAAPQLSQWTSAKLILPASAVKEAADEHIWVAEGGARIAYVRADGAKERFVVDGQPGKAYDKVNPFRMAIARSEVFSAGGQHYLYEAVEGDLHCIVIDGQEGPRYDYINILNSYVSSTGHAWSYYATRPGEAFEAVLVVNEQVLPLPAGVGPKDVLLAFGHSLYVETDLSTPDKSVYTAVFDGKRDKAFGYIRAQSLKLHVSGAYSYTACDKIGEGYYAVISGEPGPKYDYVADYSIGFSADGKHYGYSASRGETNILVIDGKETSPLPGFASNITFSLDGSHWACEVGKDSSYAVLLDGKEVGSNYTEVAYGSLTFSADGQHLAFVVKKDKECFVVLDRVAQPSYAKVEEPVFSPDGRRLAYVAWRSAEGKACVVSDGREQKEYDRISAGTLSFGLEGRCLSYVARVGQEGDEGFLVVDGEERTRWDKILPRPNSTLFVGADLLSYVASHGGAYYWVEERLPPPSEK